MNIEIKAEDVEKIVRDELIKAGLGKVISETVVKSLNGYNSPIDTAIQKYVGEVAGRLIREHFAKDIESAIAAAIESKITKEIIDSVVDAAVEKMRRAAEESRY